jgi:hypothetical protein
MLKKLKAFFQEKNSEKRNRYRFDIQYRDEIKVFINNKERKLKEISLEGFSFFRTEGDSFDQCESLKVSLRFESTQLDFSADLKNTTKQFYGCSVVSRKDLYSKLIINELSPYLISFIN